MSPEFGLALLALPTPTPTPLPYNPDDVTPGVVGFLFTFVIFLLVGLIAWDLLRRVRRVKYREEVRTKLEAELAARGGVDGARGAGADSAGGDPDALGSAGGDGSDDPRGR